MSSNKFHKQNQQASDFKSGAIASEVTGQPKVEAQVEQPVVEVKVEQPVVEAQVGLPSVKKDEVQPKKEVKMMKVLTLAELPSYKGRRIPKGTRLVVPETAFDKNLMVEIKQEEK